jgi:alkanesulfonate monooxygenase SsuD/methylene tetrahydromethanopterin reductase-like flavin-dependent oxidoreductase (luciferase family)
LQPPVPGFADQLHPGDRALLAEVLSCTAIGDPDAIRKSLAAFIARTGADELMLTGMIFDHPARVRSFEIAAEVRGRMAQEAA